MKKGFTLIELLLVLGLLAIVVSILFASINTGSRKEIALNKCKEIAIALNQYRMNTGSYPSDLSSFLNNSDYFTKEVKGNFVLVDNGDSLTVKEVDYGVGYTFKKSQISTTP